MGKEVVCDKRYILIDAATGVRDIENGELEIEKSSVNNLLGQHVSAAAKGLLIKNGKKYLNK